MPAALLFTLMRRINFSFSCVEHENSFIIKPRALVSKMFSFQNECKIRVYSCIFQTSDCMVYPYKGFKATGKTT